MAKPRPQVARVRWTPTNRLVWQALGMITPSRTVLFAILLAWMGSFETWTVQSYGHNLHVCQVSSSLHELCRNHTRVYHVCPGERRRPTGLCGRQRV